METYFLPLNSKTHDTPDQPWQAMPDLPFSEGRNYMFNLDMTTTYILGGDNPTGVIDKWFRLNLKTNQFEEVGGKSMLKARKSAAYTKISGKYFPQCLKELFQ